MAEVIKVRNVPAQHIGVVNSAPSPEMNIVAKEITENGRYEARTEGVTGFDPVIVNVPSREEIGYENGYAAGYGKGSTDGYADALAKRTELAVTANGEYIPEGESTGFSKVSVNLPSDSDTIDGLIDGTLSGAYRNDRVTAVKKHAFSYCSLLTGIYMPNLATLGDSAFAQCNNLKEVNLPKARIIGSYSFDSNSALENITLPSASTIYTYCFRSCTSLTRADFEGATNIQAYCFQKCTSLTTLILRKTKVTTLSHTTAFTNTPIADGTGYIYVPDDLVEDYKVATNWATYASQIKPISELEE